MASSGSAGVEPTSGAVACASATVRVPRVGVAASIPEGVGTSSDAEVGAAVTAPPDAGDVATASAAVGVGAAFGCDAIWTAVAVGFAAGAVTEAVHEARSATDSTAVRQRRIRLITIGSDARRRIRRVKAYPRWDTMASMDVASSPLSLYLVVTGAGTALITPFTRGGDVDDAHHGI